MIKVVIIACALLTVLSILCISMIGILLHIQTRSHCIHTSSNEEKVSSSLTLFLLVHVNSMH